MPSLIVLGVALWLIAKLASRLIHPQAGWFAIFACLALKGFDYEAADARPYALGTCAAVASLFFWCAGWIPRAGATPLLFTVFAALLWRVHLVFWPFYGIFAIYVAVRILRSETAVTWKQAAAVFGAIGLTLIPVAMDADQAGPRSACARHRRSPHRPRLTPHAQISADRAVRRRGAPCRIPFAPAQKIAGRGLESHWHARAFLLGADSGVVAVASLALFAFSLAHRQQRLRGPLSIAGPAGRGSGCYARSRVRTSRARLAHCAATRAGRVRAYRLGTVGRGLAGRSFGPLIIIPIGATPRVPWMNGRDADTPVLLPSPFIEAKPPVWRPNYPLPGFLYCYLPVYKISGKPYLLPFERSPEGGTLCLQRCCRLFRRLRRFLIYGGDKNVFVWRSFFASQPELGGWGNRQLHSFGDVDVAIFQNPGSLRALAACGAVPSCGAGPRPASDSQGRLASRD